MGSLSSNHFSVDQQIWDALDYLRHEHPEAYAEVLGQFPEIDRVQWCGSWIDTDAMGVDQEWDILVAIEATDLVYWEEGEPWPADTPRADD